ncbi:Trans-resveratrol di-O-methyltransferase [Morella rubra]|uniref:Trans-resveratrol di-O-methyltransferase n=1 Tax=Morella rubra TaxID=262757 RepID=A0A6A1WCK7_9ROSI|nr:Trans-resveratrol di-O-methyltransferase [Morella rubra]
MRLLVNSGFFTRSIKGQENQQEEEEEAYALTPSSKLVLKENVTNSSPFILAMLDPALVNSWQYLGDWFRGSELTPFGEAHGMGFWDYCDRNAEYGNMFNEGMASDSRLMSLVVKDYKSIFEGLGSLVDVGGGTGIMARIISEAFPHMNCTVFDLPHVVANLPDSSNLIYVGGDMFQSIPSADAILIKVSNRFSLLKDLQYFISKVHGILFSYISNYILQWILHDWNDDECVSILKRCKEAITSNGKKGKVIVIDLVIDEEKDEQDIIKTKLLFDALMMVLVTGKERNKKNGKSSSWMLALAASKLQHHLA